MSGSFRDRLASLRAEVDAAARATGRTGGAVTLLGVSKKHPPEAISEAIAAGLEDIGENYLQEAAAKLPLVAGTFRRHFIGHVQTNKARKIAELFDVVQTIDRADAALAVAKAAGALGKVLPVLVQVNVSPSERSGCPPGDAEGLAELVRAHASLRMDGIMAIGPITEDRDEIARAFALAAKTFAIVGGSTLSIGMSGDWREAVRAGSTMIRIGAALFGPRVN